MYRGNLTTLAQDLTNLYRNLADKETGMFSITSALREYSEKERAFIGLQKDELAILFDERDQPLFIGLYGAWHELRGFEARDAKDVLRLEQFRQIGMVTKEQSEEDQTIAIINL